jgi:hypothetical protein
VTANKFTLGAALVSLAVGPARCSGRSRGAFSWYGLLPVWMLLLTSDLRWRVLLVPGDAAYRPLMPNQGVLAAQVSP